MDLSKFLEEDANLHAREELFNYRLLFDMKAASAVNGYHLQTYYSDVDHDGFDIIFDDGDNLRKVQLKTVSGTASTATWHIHKSIIRPSYNNCEELGFDLNQHGVEGGVILMDYKIDEGQQISTSYYFADIYIINAITLGLIGRHGNTRNAAGSVRHEASKGASQEKVGSAKGLFVPAASPQHLLRLVGLHSSIAYSGWQRRVRELSRIEWGPKTKFDFEEPGLSRLAGYRRDLPGIMSCICGIETYDGGFTTG
jgi:hypothetical protein